MKLSNLVRAEAPRLIGSALAGTLAALLEFAPAAGIVLIAADAVVDGAVSASAVGIAGLVAAAVVLRFLMTGASLVLSHAAAFRILRQVREHILERLGAAPLHEVTGRDPGDLKTALVDDIAGLEGALAHQVPDFLSAVLGPVVAVSALLVVDWRLALATVGLLPVAFLVQASFMRNMGQQYARWHAAEQTANEAILEFLQGIPVLKAFDREAASMARVRSGLDGIVALAIQMTRRTSFGWSAFSLLLTGNLAVVVPVGIWLAREWELSPITLVLFVVLCTTVTKPLMKLIFLFGGVQQNLVRMRRIRALLDLSDDPASTRQDHTIPAAPEVVIEGVRFAYDASRGDVLNGIDARLPGGGVTGLIGPSGSGKTTLARLIRGIGDPRQGRVLVGGVDLATVSRERRRRTVALIDQHTVLFSGTVAENLRVADPEASDTALWEALEAANLARVIENLEGGLNAELGERGSGLSGGERQRLAIARALLTGAPVVILDEVTANLDALSTAAVQRGLGALLAGRTVIAIGHRLRPLRDAHHLLVLDHGAIAGAGTHQQLLDDCPVYARSWDAQRRASGWRLPTASHAPGGVC